ncbi:hypothetical protein PENSPDRAFT_218548 [Peniophora sp. CONT]|nr:hypothetical protein PENSPDRAFT_218548 [Peniophora sp. CONT]
MLPRVGGALPVPASLAAAAHKTGQDFKAPWTPSTQVLERHSARPSSFRPPATAGLRISCHSTPRRNPWILLYGHRFLVFFCFHLYRTHSVQHRFVLPPVCCMHAYFIVPAWNNTTTIRVPLCIETTNQIEHRGTNLTLVKRSFGSRKRAAFNLLGIILRSYTLQVSTLGQAREHHCCRRSLAQEQCGNASPGLQLKRATQQLTRAWVRGSALSLRAANSAKSTDQSAITISIKSLRALVHRGTHSCPRSADRACCRSVI